MTRREYRGGAATLVLATTIDADDTTIVTTGDVTGWPTGASYSFFVRIGSEKILCSSRSGNTLTVAGSGRGVDGTIAASHTAPVDVEHVLDAATIDEANAHVNDTARHDHTQYLRTADHQNTAIHLVGTSIPAGSPSSSPVGDSAANGTSTSAARADHKHAREAFGSPSTQAIGDAAANGTATTVARSDHKHAMPAFGSPVAEAIGSSAADGSAATVARSDHRHAMPAAGTPGTSAPGDAASAGSAATVALSDHKHAREETLGLTQNEDKNDGDTSAIAASSSLVVATYALTTTKRRIIEINAYCTIVNNVAASGSFAGHVSIYMNAAPMYGATRRFNSFPLTDGVVDVSFSTKTVQDAGTWTFTIVVDADLGSVDVKVRHRDLTVFAIGG